LVKKLGGDDAVGCIFPADHLIAPKKSFGNDLKRAIKAAEKSDAIVTIGISPDRPATEYGYIECAGRLGPADKALAQRASRFVEKPDAKTADRYLKSGRYLWNAGIFIWRTKALESAFASAAPDIGKIIHPLASAKNVQTSLARHYPGVRKISFDYAVMEKTREILVVRSTFKWDDVGSLQSLARHFAADANGNIVIGEPVLHETKSSIAIAGGPGKLVMAGLKDIIAVHTKDAILIMAKDAACDMKKITSPQP
jgi:mannose-1-phosphate guanylyltransferase